MKHLKTFEAYNTEDRVDREAYEKAKKSTEYKVLIDFGFIDITTKRQEKNGTFAFESPLRHMKYGIYSNFYGRVNIDKLGYGKNVPRDKIGQPSALFKGKNQPTSYEECFTRLLHTEKAARMYLSKYTYDTVDKPTFINKIIKKITTNPSKIANVLDVNYLPSLGEHPELETAYRKVLEKGIKVNPIIYLPYFKYLEDGENYDIRFGYKYPDSQKMHGLSTDILGWLEDLPEDEMRRLKDKIIEAIEDEPLGWYKTHKWNFLPESIKKELNWLGRGVKTNMWNLK